VNCPALSSSVEFTMTTIATLIHPRDAKAQKKPINPRMATVYLSGIRHDSAKLNSNTHKHIF